MISKCQRVLVLGASGMLGNAVLRFFNQSPSFDVVGSVRSFVVKHHLYPDVADKIIVGHDLNNADHLADLFRRTRPDLVINCVGIVKQLDEANDPLMVIPINTLLPHRLLLHCDLLNARLIHMSTDCVFSGNKGNYKESDPPDATDVYGRSKLLGEVDQANAVTLRTSLIGHELIGSRSLINWFLAHEGVVKGYLKAIFSGLPTVEIARIIRDFIIPNPDLHGVYHVSSLPINKYELLMQVAEVYGKKINIEPDDSIVIDRSLDSTRFQIATGFQPKSWAELIRRMHEFQ